MPAKSRQQAAKYHHGNLQELTLREARTLLEERGPSFLNLREIARRIGVSDPALYHHFPNRDALALGLVEQGCGELVGILSAAADGNEQGLLGLGEAYVSFALSNPALYRLMFGEGFASTSQAGGDARNLRQTTYALIETRLQSRMSGSDLSHAASFLWALAHGLSLLLVDRQIETKEETQEFARAVLQLARHGFDRSVSGQKG